MATFLLIHGIPGSAATWDAVRGRLEPEHHVLAPNLLGFGGRRSAPPGQPDDLLAPSQARRLLEVLDRHDARDVTLVGHDFGGPVAAHLLAADPGRFAALALFATNAFPDTPVPFPLSLVRSPVVGGAAARLLFSGPSLALMVRRGTGRDSERLDLRRYVGDREQRAAIATIFAASLARLRELYTPVARALAAQRVPTLVGWGDRDPFFAVDIGERTAALVPGARFRLYEGAGHFLPEERPDAVAADLLALAATVGSR